jgi:hypothetical protein
LGWQAIIDLPGGLRLAVEKSASSPQREAARSNFFGKSAVAANYPMYAMPQHGRCEGSSTFPGAINGRPEVSAGTMVRKPAAAKPTETDGETRPGTGDQHHLLIKQVVDTEIDGADQQ